MLALTYALGKSFCLFVKSVNADNSFGRFMLDVIPETVVQQQLDAYNARDLDALLASYAPDAQMFEHPSKLLATGSQELRDRFTLRFQEPNLHATLLRRIVSGSVVVDHERVTRTFPEGPGEIELVMIYQVEGSRIAKAWSIAGEKRLLGTA